MITLLCSIISITWNEITLGINFNVLYMTLSIWPALLIINHVEHLFIYLVTTCIYSWVRYPFRGWVFFAFLKCDGLLLICWVLRVSVIFWIQALYQMCFANTLSQSAFSLLSFKEQTMLILLNSNLSFSFFHGLYLQCCIWKDITYPPLPFLPVKL